MSQKIESRHFIPKSCKQNYPKSLSPTSRKRGCYVVIIDQII